MLGKVRDLFRRIGRRSHWYLVWVHLIDAVSTVFAKFNPGFPFLSPWTLDEPVGLKPSETVAMENRPALH